MTFAIVALKLFVSAIGHLKDISRANKEEIKELRLKERYAGPLNRPGKQLSH